MSDQWLDTKPLRGFKQVHERMEDTFVGWHSHGPLGNNARPIRHNHGGPKDHDHYDLEPAWGKAIYD